MAATNSKLTVLALTLALLASCSHKKNPVSNDGGGQNSTANDPYTRDQLSPEGQVDTTADGYNVVGKLTVASDAGPVELTNADLALHFDSLGRLTGVSGKAQIPSPSKEIEFANPIEGDVGYYSGSYINSHPEFTLQVKDDRSYFVFYFAAALEMSIGTSSDTTATKPFTIKAPVGGKAVMIIDYDDPLFYTYGEQDLLGAAGTGDSKQGLIPYVPEEPLVNFPKFDGQSIRTGGFDIFKVLGVSGYVIRSTRYSADLLSDDVLGSLGVGAKAGINGNMEFAVGVKDIIGFTVPMGTAAGGVTFDATANGVQGKCAFNGLADPDLSWWPSVVGFKPDGQLQSTGHVMSTGDFDLSLAGSFSLLTPHNSTAFEGHTEVNHAALTMAGSYTHNDTTIGVTGVVTKDRSEFGVVLPEQLRFDATGIRGEIDRQLSESDQALADLQTATANYQFELSLRGLRSTLPGIVDNAKQLIADNIASAKQQVRDAADWCSGSPDLSPIDNLVAPYVSALNRLKAAALDSTDDNASRTEIEAALRDLAAHSRINSDVAINGQVHVVVCVPYSTTRHIDVAVLTSTQRSQILTAADNVKFIASTSDIMIQAQTIYDSLRPKDELNRIRDEIDQGLAQIPTVDGVGMIHVFAPSTWEFYVVLSGQKKVLGEFDPLNPASVAETVTNAILGEL